MATKRVNGQAGERLKAYRRALGVTLRDVQEYSRHIAKATGEPAFSLSHSYLTSLENGGMGVPSLHKLFTLSVVYRIRFVDLLLSFGLDLENISKFETEIKLPRTHVIWHDIYHPERPIEFPIKLDPGFKLEQTDLLSRVVETWGEVPIGFIQHMGIRKHLYGFIGTNDFTLHPLIRPGSIVSIDSRDTKIQTSGWETDFDRPVYFLQLRGSYAFGWCQLGEGRLNLIPYSAARCPIRQYKYPDDVDVIGKVIAVAMTLGEQPRATKSSAKPVPRLGS
jgi:transcriptional regulator with XRE-family HTH domain